MVGLKWSLKEEKSQYQFVSLPFSNESPPARLKKQEGGGDLLVIRKMNL